MINEGIDPVNFLNELLELIYFIQQKNSTGNINSDLPISESEQEIIAKISNNLEASTLIIFWQFILKAIEELSVVSNPNLSLEMLIVRLVHLKEMPSYENILESIKKNNFDKAELSNDTNIDLNISKKNFTNNEKEIGKVSKDQIKNITQTKPILSSFETRSFKLILSSILRSIFFDLEYSLFFKLIASKIFLPSCLFIR